MQNLAKNKISGRARACLAVGLSAALAACGGDGSSGSTGSSAPPIQLKVTASQATIVAGQSTQITATKLNDPTGAAVLWAMYCSQADCGTLTSSATSATYTAPAAAPAADLTVTITARADAGSSVTASVQITVASSPISLSLATSTVPAGSSTQVTATLVNDPGKAGVKWSVSCPNAPCGSVSPVTTASGAASTFSAPPAAPAADLTVTITATAADNAAISASTTLTVPAIQVAVSSSASGKVAARSTVQMTATVSDDPNDRGVSWTLQCSASDCGTIAPLTSASGAPVTYTAPSTPPPTNVSVTVAAQSLSASTSQGSAVVVVSAVVVTIAPVSALIPLNVGQQFTGTVGFDPTASSVGWQLLQTGVPCGGACGVIAPLTTTNGAAITYTAPASLPAQGAVTLQATSVPDNLGSGTARVVVTNGTVALAPLDMTIASHATAQTATLKNTGNSNLSISKITVSNARFTQSNNCAKLLGPGASCAISVSFSAVKGRPASGTLSIVDSSADSPQTINLNGVRASAATAAIVKAALARTGAIATPRPTGDKQVGTRELSLIDPTRVDPYSGEGSNRELMVRFWYPMAANGTVCSRADYSASQTWNYFGVLLGVTLPQVLTHSCSDAAIATGAHPVVFLSHGFTGVATDYTYLAEDLASRGYIVVAINHTHEATAVTFPDGRLEKSLLGSHLDDSWRADPQTLDSAVALRLADLKFVVNELSVLNYQRDSDFADKLDLSKIALVGHSLGGLTTIRALQNEPRFKAGVLLDALVPEHLAGSLQQPVLDIVVGRQQWNETDCSLWDSLGGVRTAVNLPRTEHIALSDAVWLLKGHVKTGNSPEAMIAAMRGYVAAFLDVNLRSIVPQPMLSGSEPTAGAVVAHGSQSLCAQR